MPPGPDLPLKTGVYELLSKRAQSHSANIAIGDVSDGAATPTKWTYEDLFRKSVAAANLFLELGAGPDAPVAYMLPIILETHAVVLGAEMVSVACAVNPFLDARVIAGLLEACDARILVIGGPSFSPADNKKLAEIIRLRPNIAAIVEIGTTCGVNGAVNFNDALGATPSSHIQGRLQKPEAVSACFHTGGTTSAPRFAPQTQRRQLVAAEAARKAFAFTSDSKIISGMPLFHIGGLFCGGLVPFVTGAGVIQLGPAGYRDATLMSRFWEILDNEKATHISAVATVYGRLANLPLNGADLSSVEYAISSAAVLSGEIRSRFETHTNIPIRECYGLTEATFIVTANGPDQTRRPGTVGRPLPDLEVAIYKTTANGYAPAKPGETGLLTVRGDTVFDGYLGAPESDDLWIEGRLNTGDLASIDEDGYVTIRGREKDLIIRGGHNIDPAIIEDALLKHDAVFAVAAVGKPHEDLGEVPAAFVQLKENAEATHEDLLAFAADHIGERAAVPKTVWITSTLPMTGVGKVSKPPLRLEAIRLAALERLANEAPDVKARSLQVTEGKDTQRTIHINLEEPSYEQEARRLLTRLGFRVRFHQQAN